MTDGIANINFDKISFVTGNMVSRELFKLCAPLIIFLITKASEGSAQKNVIYAHNWWPKHKKLLWMADNCSEKVKEIKCAIIVWVDRIAGAAGKCSWQNCPLTFSILLYDVLIWDESEACNNCLVTDSRDAVAPKLAFDLTKELFGGPPEKKDETAGHTQHLSFQLYA